MYSSNGTNGKIQDHLYHDRYAYYQHLYDAGFNLVPCSPDDDGKGCKQPWKQYQSNRIDPDNFAAFLHQAKLDQCNMAIVAGSLPGCQFGVVCLDGDSEQGSKVIAERCPPTDLGSNSGVGHRHFIFLHPRDRPIRSGQYIKIDGEKIDICVKADGALFTAPGSFHSERQRVYIPSRELITPELLASVPVFDRAWFPEIDFDKPVPSEFDIDQNGWVNRPGLVPIPERRDIFREHVRKIGPEQGDNNVRSFQFVKDGIEKCRLSVDDVIDVLLDEFADESNHFTEGMLQAKATKVLELIDPEAPCWVEEIGRLSCIPDPILPPTVPAPAHEGNGKPPGPSFTQDELAKLHGDSETPEAKNQAEINKPAKTVEQQLVQIGRQCELWRTPDFISYAATPMGNHGLRSGSFRRWLCGEYYAKFGKTAKDDKVKAAVDVLEHLADKSVQVTYLRFARIGQAIYIDLGTPAWDAVEITAAGWRVIKPPVKFRRSSNFGELPRPERGGSVDELRNFINCTDEDWTLILGWLLDAYKARGPFAILVANGEQGSAKSTLCRLLRSLVDPVLVAPLTGLPKDAYSLAIDCCNEYCLAFDNISYIHPDMSDILCRVSTGAGVKTRKLYSDNEQVVLPLSAPILLNGIVDFCDKSDLIDRSLVTMLPSIPPDKRTDEVTFYARWAAARGRIFGALLDCVVRGLAKEDSTSLPAMARMADTARWVTACTGTPAFVEQQLINEEESTGIILENSFAAYMLQLVLKKKNPWCGTNGELLEEMKSIISHDGLYGELPKNGQALSGQLRRVAVALRTAWGITIEKDKSHKKGRKVTITRGDAISTGFSEGDATGTH